MLERLPEAFSGGSRAPQEPPREPQEPPREPQEPPRRPPEASGSHFGSILGLRGSFPKLFGKLFEAISAACLADVGFSFFALLPLRSPSLVFVFCFSAYFFFQDFAAIGPESPERSRKPAREVALGILAYEAPPAQSAEAAARSAAARLHANARARCLAAPDVSLLAVLVFLGASCPSPLAVFAAIFALLHRLPCLRLSL